MTTTEHDDELRIRALMREIARGFLERDVETLRHAIDDDFTFVDPTGAIVTKEAWLEDVATGRLRFQSVEAGEIEFRHLADSIRVRGELTVRAEYTRGNYNGTFRYLGVYAKRGDERRLLLTSAKRAEST